jgi:hypothetical protein
MPATLERLRPAVRIVRGGAHVWRAAGSCITTLPGLRLVWCCQPDRLCCASLSASVACDRCFLPSVWSFGVPTYPLRARSNERSPERERRCEASEAAAALSALQLWFANLCVPRAHAAHARNALVHAAAFLQCNGRCTLLGWRPQAGCSHCFTSLKASIGCPLPAVSRARDFVAA